MVSLPKSPEAVIIIPDNTPSLRLAGSRIATTRKIGQKIIIERLRVWAKKGKGEVVGAAQEDTPKRA